MGVGKRFQTVRVLVLIAAITAALLTRAQPSSEAATGTMMLKTLAARGIVLVHGTQTGTAFAVWYRSGWTYFLTAAHLLDGEAWIANKELADDDPDKRSSDEWLTITNPLDRKVYIADVPFDPDFAKDIAVFRVKDMTTPPRPLCIAQAVNANATAVSGGFTVKTLYNSNVPPNPAMLDSANVSVPDEGFPDEFQFTALTEQGFSGGPLIDLRDGNVIGILKSAPFVLDSSGRQQSVLSVGARNAVSPAAIFGYLLANHLANGEDQIFAQHNDVSLTQPFPDVTAAGALRLMHFDDQRGNDGAMIPFYHSFEGQLENELTRSFGLDAHTPADVRPDSTPYLAGYSPSSLATNLCRFNGTDYAGVLGIKRAMSAAGTATATLMISVGLYDCWGNLIDRASTDPIRLGQVSSTTSQVSSQLVTSIIGALHSTLHALAGADGRRLTNFAYDGLPLGDDEYRGFYDLERQGEDSVTIGAFWQHGYASVKVFHAKTYALDAIDGVTTDQFKLLNGQQLDGLFQSGATLLAHAHDGPSLMPTTIKGADRCFYMSFREQELFQWGTYYLHDVEPNNAL